MSAKADDGGATPNKQLLLTRVGVVAHGTRAVYACSPCSRIASRYVAAAPTTSELAASKELIL